MSSKMALLVSRIVFTSLINRGLVPTKAPRDVDVAGAIAVEPKRKECQPDVVRGDGRHPGPLEAGRQTRVDPGVLRGDLDVAVEGAELLGQEGLGDSLPAVDRLRHSPRGGP